MTIKSLWLIIMMSTVFDGDWPCKVQWALTLVNPMRGNSQFICLLIQVHEWSFWATANVNGERCFVADSLVQSQHQFKSHSKLKSIGYSLEMNCTTQDAPINITFFFFVVVLIIQLFATYFSQFFFFTYYSSSIGFVIICAITNTSFLNSVSRTSEMIYNILTLK